VTNTNNPWPALDVATGEKKLRLNPDLMPAINNAAGPYQQSLNTLVADALDDTTGYFGTPERNDLARILQEAFNARGRMLTDYLKEQRSQTELFVKTAQDAARAFELNETN
jgi:hypothetical protein